MAEPCKRKLSELKKYPGNPRTIKDTQFKQLCKSIEDNPDYFEARPVILSDRTGELIIIAGNQRYDAAKHLKLKEIPTHLITGLTEDREKEIIIRDNISNGDWDMNLLADWDKVKLEEWGVYVEWPAEQLDAVEDDYEIPETIETDIVLGDLFEIGNHRLLCGDAKDSDAVAKLMNGRLADLVVTDPPYNTGMKANKDAKAWLSQMFNDSFTPEEWHDLKVSSFNNYNIFTKGECAFYVFIDWRRVAEFKEILETIADVKNVIVWDKGVHGLGSDYKSTYENIVVGKKGKPQINNRYGLDYQDIWRVQRKMGRDEDHATKKPIELLMKPIIHASKENDIVLDLFGGSGSTMITCQQLKRSGYLMELDPKYCQVIIDRMRKLDPTLIIKRNREVM